MKTFVFRRQHHSLHKSKQQHDKQFYVFVIKVFPSLCVLPCNFKRGFVVGSIPEISLALAKVYQRLQKNISFGTGWQTLDCGKVDEQHFFLSAYQIIWQSGNGKNHIFFGVACFNLCFD